MMITTALLMSAALIPVGDHAINMRCTGRGTPTVVVENGFGESLDDWKRVQDRLARTTRVCSYDRAGYFGSGPGPFPRTFDQINLELKLALEHARERGPFILAGHSFGGPVIRNFVERYPELVAAMVLIDAAHENQQTFYGGAFHRLREGAQGRVFPPPQLTGSKPMTTKSADLEDAQSSEREWSQEVFARWFAQPQTGVLGSKPLLILVRNSTSLTGTDSDAGVARERVINQVSLATLSDDAVVSFIGFDHDMQKSMPDVLAKQISEVVFACRSHTRISGPKSK